MHLTHATIALFGPALIVATALPAQDKASVPPEPGRVVTLPKQYRDWHLISIAHEAGSLNDIRAVLGNKVAADAFRSGKRPFPNGAVIVRLAYRYVASERNDAVFGQRQSFVAGDPTNVQISVKDSRQYAGTGGWGYGQFVNGAPDPGSPPVATCLACHHRLDAARDLVFTDYAP